MNLVHSCIILLLVIVELVVKVVPCTLLGESQVGGEVVDAFTHGLLLLMQSTLCTKEVTLCDVGVHVVVVLNEEWVGRSTWPIHHSKQRYVSGRKRRTNTKCTLIDVENGSKITPMCINGIAQFVPFLVGSHTYTRKSLWWSLVRMVAQNLMQLLVRFNNVGKDSQVCNATSRPRNIRYTETHTQIDKWDCAIQK